MRVVLASRAVAPFHGYGGMERYVYYLGKHLAENGVRVEIVTSQSMKRVRVDEGLNYVFLPPLIEGRRYSSIRYYLFVRNCSKYLQGREFDVLHAFGIAAYHYLRLSRRRATVVQPFGNEEFMERHREDPLKRLYLDLLIRKPKIYSVRRADAVAAEGEIQAREIMDLFGIPREKIFLLPDGVDLDEIDRYLENIKITREELGLQDADIVLINVNRLAPNKGVPYLIDALKLLNEVYNVKLILVGSGPEETNIKNRIKALGLENRVLHFKNIPDETLFQLYALADISVTPTLYEGLPLVILEAMACGKPVVASNVSEVPQAVRDGVNGFLVPPRDPGAIAKAVLKIYESNLIEKMGRESRRIAENYDWSIIAKRAIKEYEKLV